jgi:hypothetical protein
MSAANESYTAAEILAHSRLSWWEYAAKAGLPTHVGPRTIERGPQVATRDPKRKPPRDYLSEPRGGAIDYLNLPLHVLKSRGF